ncbi:MAG: polysaccharide biosynthesis protein [Alphaproteobacteria bacterium]
MPRLNRAWIAYAHDILMAAAAFLLALFLRMGESTFTLPTEFVAAGAALFAVLAAAVFWPMGLYRGVWRYASINDGLQIVKAVTLVVLLFVPLMFVATRAEYLPRSLPVILWFVMLALLGGPRLIYRLVKDGRLDLSLQRPDRSAVPVLLVGAGDETETFIRALGRAPGAPYRAVGVLDEKGSRVGRQIRGVPVLGRLADADAVVGRLAAAGAKPRRLVVTRAHLGAPALRQLLDVAERRGMVLSRMPQLTELQRGDAPSIDVRPVDVEDLLGRPQAELDRTAMHRLVAGRRVLVTGAGGTIGSELVRQIAARAPAEIVLVDSSELALYTIDLELARLLPDVSRRTVLADVRDRDRLDGIFADTRPELVFHAAALKHVPMCEAHPTEGILTNVQGTRVVADLARRHGARAMVLISTDKAVNPSSVMGATKRIAESYCQALDLARVTVPGSEGTHFITVRFGNVLGSTGSVVPLFQQQIAAGGPVTVTHPEMTRYFMTTREAVELVLQASVLGTAGDAEAGTIFVLDMGEPVRIVDLAEQMIRLAGQRPHEDVAIDFIGLRPGEKLHEQLFHDAEPTRPTANAALRLAAPRTADPGQLARALDDLAAAARDGDETRWRALLGQLVPEYRNGIAVAPERAAAR